MEILKIIDNEDGSATLECEFQEDEVQVLLNHAVNDILKKQIKKYNQEASIHEQRSDS